MNGKAGLAAGGSAGLCALGVAWPPAGVAMMVVGGVALVAKVATDIHDNGWRNIGDLPGQYWEEAMGTSDSCGSLEDPLQFGFAFGSTAFGAYSLGCVKFL